MAVDDMLPKARSEFKLKNLTIIHLVSTFRQHFGLENHCLENLLWNVFWMMRCLTVNADSRSKFRAGLLHYGFGVTCFVLYLYYYLFGLIYNWGWVYPVTQDIVALVIIISLAFSSQISTVKIFAVKIMRQKIVTLIDNYRDYEATLDPDSRYAKYALAALRPVKRRALIFWSTFCTASIVYLLLPAFLPGHNLPENNLKIYGLEPTDVSPNYEIAYTLDIFAGIFATAGISNVTVLFIVLSGYIEAHVLAIANEFDNLWEDVLAAKDDQISSNRIDNKRQQEVKGRLRLLIRKHVTILNCHKLANKLFNDIIALEFFFTVIAMCSMLLGGLEETYLQIPYTMAQLVVDTIVGQRLIDSSNVLEDSIYNCGWENFDTSNMRTVHLILQSSQRTLKLTAGSITYLGYVCFASIVRFVYSSYATLHHAMNK